MSFYRSLLAAIAAMALVAPVFADDPAANATGTMAKTATSTTMEQTKVDINKATAKELMKVKGINSARAKAIINYRKTNGDFKNLDDLTKVSGFEKINGKTLKNIQDQLSVE